MPIRMATLDDLSQILRIEEEAFATDLIDEHNYKKFLVKNGTSCQLLVATDQLLPNQIYGFILVLTNKQRTNAVIHSFAVKQTAHGTGVGQALIDAGGVVAKEKGHKGIITHVRVDNWPAIRRYKKSGFHIIGAEANYYEDGCDAVKYLRNL